MPTPNIYIYIYIYIYILQHRATGGSWSITTAVVKICHRHSPTQHLKWDNHIESIVKKAQQRFYFLRQLRKFKLPQELLKQFYSAIIVSVLCTSITVWFSSATKSDLRRLWSVVRTNHWYTPPHSPRTVLIQSEKRLEKPLQTPHIQHTPSLNCYRLVRYRALSIRMNRHRFFTQAIHLMNTWHLMWNKQHYYTIILFISNLHMSDRTHNCLYCISCFCYFVHCLFLHYYFIICVLSCHSIAL